MDSNTVLSVFETDWIKGENREKEMENKARNIIEETKQELLAAGIDDAATDAWILFETYTGIRRERYFLEPDKEITKEQREKMEAAVKRRKEHVPLQYITGEQEFMGLCFKVTEDVLIPRQDTEHLVEEAMRFSKGKKVLDLCTGSGCIILSLEALEAPEVCIGVDLSRKALDVAEENARNLELDKTEFIWSDLFEGLSKYRENGKKFDLIVSNPPYIRREEIKKLSLEVREHEPLPALDGGEDGLSFYRRIAKEAKEYLEDGGRILFEIGYDQGESVPKILKEEGYEAIYVKKDYAGLDRVAGAVWKRKE